MQGTSISFWTYFSMWSYLPFALKRLDAPLLPSNQGVSVFSGSIALNTHVPSWSFIALLITVILSISFVFSTQTLYDSGFASKA